MPNPLSTGWTKYLPWCILIALWLILTADLLLGLSVVGYRDSGYLYYPLFESIDQACSSGRAPLLNPNCNFGFPTAADGSSSVFYPGKLVFWFRWLPFPARYGCYQSIHLLIAAAGSFLLARKLGLDRTAATLSALTYAFGAPVIFQATNVIYLVSAAWLPFALREVHSMASHNQPWSATLKAAAYCALILLGGDPQMVYHVGLIALATLTVRGWLDWRTSEQANDAIRKSPFRLMLQAAGCLLLLVAVTGLLSCVQLMPSSELAQRSERTGQGQVVNVYSAIQHAMRPDAESGWNQLAAPLLQQDDLTVGQYQFSQPPWTLIEMLLPNVGGKPFPINRRWLDHLPAADRMWYPSLYLGLLGLILAVPRIRLWGSDRQAIWISWITLFFLLGSFGWYGGVWLYREIASWLASGNPSETNPWAAPVGGVYWWLSLLLPRYYSFRYPAKLFVVASLGFALLAGMGLQRLIKHHETTRPSDTPATMSPARHYSGICWTLGGTVWALWLVEWLVRPSISNLAATPPLFASPFGPLDVDGSVQQIQAAILHASIVIVAWLAWRSIARVRRLRSQTFAIGMLFIAAADVGVANSWLLAKVPSATFTQVVEPPWDPAPASMDHLAVIVTPEIPSQFIESHSRQRLSEWILWQRASLQPKFHLEKSQRVIGSFHSIWPRNYRRLVDDAIAFEGTWYNGLPGPANGIQIERCELDWNQARFQLDCTQPGWHELPLFGDQHWIVTSHLNDSRSLQTRVSNNDLLEVELPAGQQALHCQYSPQWFPIGGTVTVIGWLLVLGWLAIRSAKVAWPIRP